MTSNECPCCTRKTQLGEAKGDRFYCEHCKVFFGSIKGSAIMGSIGMPDQNKQQPFRDQHIRYGADCQACCCGIYYPDGDWELPSTSDKPVKCMICGHPIDLTPHNIRGIREMTYEVRPPVNTETCQCDAQRRCVFCEYRIYEGEYKVDACLVQRDGDSESWEETDVNGICGAFRMRKETPETIKTE